MVTLEEVKTLKVAELKEELKALGLEIKGNKPDLIARLEAALKSAPAAADGDAQAGEATVKVETDGPISEETIQAVAEAAAEAAADAVKADPGDGPAEVVEQEITATEDGSGNVVVETTETATPAVKAEAEAEAPSADAIMEAVQEAAEVANTAAEVENAPATTITTVSETNAKDDTVMDTAVATGPANGAGSLDYTQTFKLFVGCVPPAFSEDDLRPTFADIGGFKEVSILRDHLTGNSRGCAFAVYEDKEHAERAIEALNKQITLPGASQPIEVRYARDSNKIQPSAEPNDKNQLFFARAPPTATEADIRDAFSEFGEVLDVSLFMNRPANTSKGCGFVVYKERKQAQDAVDNMNDKKHMDGAHVPLTVKWADLDLGAKKRKAADDMNDPNRDNNQLFFARIPKNNLTESDLEQVFGRVASVKEVVLFKAHSSATQNKGCGIVTFKSHADAVTALEELNEVYQFEGLDMTMALKWVDQDLQKRRKVGPGGPHDGPPGPYGPPQPWNGPGGPMGGAPVAEEDRPPQGCMPDAFKLFLSNVPKTWEINELREVLSAYGQIIDMNLVRDKATKEPRGVAFAWFKNKAQADRCIRELHGKSFDHGGHSREISVAKARARRVSGGPPGNFNHAPQPNFGRAPAAGYQPGYQAARPNAAPAAYQQPNYYQPQPAYDPYAQQQNQPPQQNYGYQGGYQQQPAPAYNYQQQPAANPTYTPPANNYQQTYTPTQPNTTYNPPAASYPQTGYAQQPGQQPAYGQQQGVYNQPTNQQYGAATQATPTQPAGYAYGQAAAATPTQGNFGNASQAPVNQYSYPQQTTYNPSPTDGYTYGSGGQ